MSYCQECGERFDDAFRFCPECGSQLVERAPGEQSDRGWGGDGPTAARGGDEEPTDGWRSDPASSGGPDGDAGDSGSPDGDAEASTRSWGAPGGQQTDRWGVQEERSRSETTGDRLDDEDSQRSSQGFGTPSSPVDRQPESSTSDVDFASNNVLVGLEYPTTAGWGPLAIGSLFSLVYFLIVPQILVWGYGVRLGRAAMLERPTAPEYDDWKGIFFDGLRLVGAYVPFTAAAALLVWAPLSEDLPGVAAAAGLVAVYLSGSIAPPLMATGSVVETYRDARFLRFAATLPYLKAMLGLLAVFALLSFAFLIGTVALLITIVGILLLLILSPLFETYTFYVACSVLARAYEEAAADGPLPSAEATVPSSS